MNCGTCGGQRYTEMVGRREGRCLCCTDSVATRGLRRGGIRARSGCKNGDDCLLGTAGAGAGTTGNRIWDDERLKNEDAAWNEGCTVGNNWYAMNAPSHGDGLQMCPLECDVEETGDDTVVGNKRVVEDGDDDTCVGSQRGGDGGLQLCVVTGGWTQGRSQELLREDGENIVGDEEGREENLKQSELEVGLATKMDEEGLAVDTKEDAIEEEGEGLRQERDNEDYDGNDDNKDGENKGQDEVVEDVDDNREVEEDIEEEEEEEEEVEEEEEEEDDDDDDDEDVDEIVDADDHDLDSRSADTRSVDTRSVDTRSVDTRSVDLRSLSIDTRSMDARSIEASAAQSETASIVSRAALSSLCDKADLEVHDTASVIGTPSIGRTIVADDEDDDDVVVDESIEHDSVATTPPARRPSKSYKRGDKVRGQLRAAFVRELLLSSLRL